MAGEIGFNPAVRQQQYGDSIKNDDFMANLHFNQIRQSGKIPGITETAGSPAFRGQPETDTFESSSGPGLLGTAATAAVGGAGAGATGYYFFSNPIKDVGAKTLNPEFYATMDKARLNEILGQKKIHFELFKASNLDSLSEEAKAYLTKKGLTLQEAQDLLKRSTQINYANYENVDDLVKELTSKFKGMQHQANILGKTGLFEEVTNAKNLDELKAVITKNKEFFSISGATEAEIVQKVEQLAAKGNAGVIDEINNLKNAASTYMRNQENKIFSHIDPKTGKLLDTADDTVKQLFKDFKWQQAKKYGKWGAIAAGTGALLYGLFGGSKKQA